AGAGEDDIRVLAVDGDGVDRQRGLEVAQRRPVLAAVGRLPDAALRRPNVNDLGILWVKGDSKETPGDRLGGEAPVVECSRAKLGPVEAWSGDGHAVRLLLGRDDCFGRDEAARRGTLNEGKLLRRHCLVIGASGIANVVGCRSLELVAARIALSRIE